MQIAYTLDQRLSDQPVVLTIGKFDGMHLGHQHLIATAIEQARQQGLLSAVLTWNTHPNAVVYPERQITILTSPEERIALIEQLGPDFLLMLPFTRETMATPAADYMAHIHAALPIRELWVGEDFAIGRRREGDIPRLREIGMELGYTVNGVGDVVVSGQRVSSTRVRERLLDGDVAGAIPLLGRPYELRGPVVQGDQRGRTIGFPTANIATRPDHMLPSNGVYACYVYRGEDRYPAVTNIGVRPTFDAGLRTVETHLLDFNANLYGETLRLAFVERLRGEQRFAGLAELKEQIGRDVARARQLL